MGKSRNKTDPKTVTLVRIMVDADMDMERLGLKPPSKKA